MLLYGTQAYRRQKLEVMEAWLSAVNSWDLSSPSAYSVPLCFKGFGSEPESLRRWSQVGRRRSGAEVSAAVSAFFPGRLNGTPAAGADRAQRATTLWTKDEVDASADAALRTLDEQWIAQDKVQDDADEVGNKHCQQCPHDMRHATPPGVGVDIADQQNPGEDEGRTQKNK